MTASTPKTPLSLPISEAIRTVGTLSGGAGSWGACRRWIDQHGTEGMILLFTDVGGDGTNPHVGEHKDTLRFLDDAAADLGVPLVKIRDGRDVWDVFWEKHWLGNSNLAHCSWELKTGPARDWIAANAPEAERIIVGIDFTEDHRAAAIKEKWAPYEVVFPLIDRPYWWKPQLLQMLRERGIKPPEMYDLGFGHANCVGCFKGGQGHWARVLEHFPETFAYHERREQEFRAKHGDVSCLKDRSGGDVKTMTFLELRQRRENRHGQIDLLEEGGCACFA